MMSSSDLLTPVGAREGFKTPVGGREVFKPPASHAERTAKAAMFSPSDALSPRQPKAVDTPLNHGGQGVPIKPHILKLAQSSEECIQDTGTVGQIKLELGQGDLAGHSSPGQPKSVVGHIKSGDARLPGHSTPPGPRQAKSEPGGRSDPSLSGQKKSTPSSEEARKLRQAQLQEEWKRKRGGVAQTAGSTPSDELVEELRRYEKELISDGMCYCRQNYLL